MKPSAFAFTIKSRTCLAQAKLLIEKASHLTRQCELTGVQTRSGKTINVHRLERTVVLTSDDNALNTQSGMRIIE